MMRLLVFSIIALFSSAAHAGCDFYGECHENIKPRSFNGDIIEQKPAPAPDKAEDASPPQPEPAKALSADPHPKPVKPPGIVTGNIGGAPTSLQDEKTKSEGTIGKDVLKNIK